MPASSFHLIFHFNHYSIIQVSHDPQAGFIQDKFNILLQAYFGKTAKYQMIKFSVFPYPLKKRIPRFRGM